MPVNDNHLRYRASLASNPEYAAMIRRALNQTDALFASTPSRHHTALLEKIIEDSDICLGVFNDPDSPQGWNHLIIKGTHALKQNARNGPSEELKLAAISCRDPEEAHAMKQVLAKKL